MALTGKTSVTVEPGRRKAGAILESAPEGASQTYPRGAILIRSAGYVVMHTTSCVSASILGFAAESGKNKTADGLANARYWRPSPQAEFKGVATNAVAQSLVGSTVALSQNTDGKVFVVTANASSASSVAYLRGFVDPFAAGDTNPTVYFTMIAAAVQES